MTTPPRLLIVEDDPALSLHLRHLFAPLGWHVYRADHYAAGVKMLAQNHLTVLITDLQLPDGDGVELIKLARRQPSLRHVIAISGITDGDFYLQVARQAGADVVVAKPIIPDLFLPLVSQLVTSHTSTPPANSTRTARMAQFSR